MTNALSVSARTLHRLRPAHWMAALLIGGTLSAFGAAAASLDPALHRADDTVETAAASTAAVTDDSAAAVESVASDTAAAGVVTQASTEAALH